MTQNNKTTNLTETPDRYQQKKYRLGDDIYVGTSLYLSHGADDFVGGLCKITRIQDLWNSIFIEVEERQGHGYNLEFLLQNQDKWAKEFGTKRGYPDPDYSPESNRWD